MILRVVFELILDIVDKGLKIFKILLKESFNVKLGDKNGALMTAIILDLVKADNTIEKQSGK